MENQTKYLITLLLACFCMARVHAQNAVPAAGGDAISNAGKVSYSVGQIAFTSMHSETGSVAQGVQHGFEISVTTGSGESGIALLVSTYPNPTSDLLFLDIDHAVTQDLAYQLYNTEGRRMQGGPLTAGRNGISMKHLASAVYILSVTGDEALVKSFQIIKN